MSAVWADARITVSKKGVMYGEIDVMACLEVATQTSLLGCNKATSQE